MDCLSSAFQTRIARTLSACTRQKTDRPDRTSQSAQGLGCQTRQPYSFAFPACRPLTQYKGWRREPVARIGQRLGSEAIHCQRKDDEVADDYASRKRMRRTRRGCSVSPGSRCRSISCAKGRKRADCRGRLENTRVLSRRRRRVLRYDRHRAVPDSAGDLAAAAADRARLDSLLRISLRRSALSMDAGC